MELMLCTVLLAADEPSDWYFSGGGYSEEFEIGLDLFGSTSASPKETGLRVGFGKSLNEKFCLSEEKMMIIYLAFIYAFGERKESGIKFRISLDHLNMVN